MTLSKTAAGLSATLLVSALVRRRLKDDGSSLSNRIKAAALGLRYTVYGIATFTALGLSTVILMYIVVARGGSLVDVRLAEIDADLGFDWLWYFRMLDSWPAFFFVIVLAYNSLSIQLPGILLWHGMRHRTDRMFEFLADIAVAFIPTIAGLYLAPSAGAYTLFHPERAVGQHFAWHYAVFQELRSGRPFEFVASATEGLITFPSFHSTLAVLFIYAMRGQGVWTIAAVFLNVLLLIATIPEGGHYLIDVIAGLVIAGFSIGAVRLCGLRHQIGVVR